MVGVSAVKAITGIGRVGFLWEQASPVRSASQQEQRAMGMGLRAELAVLDGTAPNLSIMAEIGG